MKQEHHLNVFNLGILDADKTQYPPLTHHTDTGKAGDRISRGVNAGLILTDDGHTSLNLARMINNPFTDKAAINYDAVASAASAAVRIADGKRDGEPADVLQISVDGMADALIMLGVKYDSPAGRKKARQLMRTVRDELYSVSIRLAHERGPLPGFNAERYLSTAWGESLPLDLKEMIQAIGLRYLGLMRIASDPSVATLDGYGASVGLAPVMNWNYSWAFPGSGGAHEIKTIESWSHRVFRSHFPQSRGEALPEYFRTALDVPLDAYRHLVRDVSQFVDGGIEAPASTVLKQMLKRGGVGKPAGVTRIPSRASAFGSRVRGTIGSLVSGLK